MPVITELYRILFGKGKLKDGDVISMSEHGRSGGVSTGQPFKFTDGVSYAMKITEDGTDTYIAIANPGTAQSAASWLAMKLDSSDGLVITYAGGSASFNQVATDLTALSYS